MIRPQGVREELAAFCKREKFTTSGPLSLAITLTEKFSREGLPSEPDTLLAPKGGQVSGLSGTKTQNILKKFGIERTLSKEGGRTSRGRMGNMKTYVKFLNDEGFNQEELDDALIFWVEKVRDYFNSKPFVISFDPSLGLQNVLESVLDQARKRQEENPGVQFVGAVMQHMVGAKLSMMLPDLNLEHNSFTTADDQKNRSGDFDVGDAAIHVTATVTESLISKCLSNLSANIIPIIVTSAKSLPTALGLAGNAGIAQRIEFFEITQFLSINIFEAGRFKKLDNVSSTKKIIEEYNDLIERYETDHSMKIKLK
jgi:hypothetical protein